MQISDLKQLLSAIDSTTEMYEEDIDVVGTLAGADIDRRTFHFKTGENDMKGNFAPTISQTQTFEVGAPYRATIRRRVKVYYSTDTEDDVSYHLVHASRIVSQAEGL